MMFPLRKNPTSPTRKETDSSAKNLPLTTTRTRPTLFRSSAITSSPLKSPGSYKSVKESLGHLTDTVATSLLPDIKITSSEFGAKGPAGKSTPNRTLVRQREATANTDPKKRIAEQFNDSAKTYVAKTTSVFMRKVAPSNVSFGRGAPANGGKIKSGAGATYRRVDQTCQLGVSREACTTDISPAKSVEMRQRNMVMAKIKFYELGGSISDDSVMGRMNKDRKKNLQEEWKKKTQLSFPLTSSSQLSEGKKLGTRRTTKVKTSNNSESKNSAEKDKVRSLSKVVNLERGFEDTYSLSAVSDSEGRGQKKNFCENSEVKEIDQSEFTPEKKCEELSENDKRIQSFIYPTEEKIKQSTDLSSEFLSESPKEEVPPNLKKRRSENTLFPMVTDYDKLSLSVSKTADVKDEHINHVQKQFLIGQNDDQISVKTTTKYVNVSLDEPFFTNSKGEMVKAMVTPPTPEDKEKEDNNIFMKEERSQSDSALGQKVVGHESSEHDSKNFLRLNTYDAESRRGSDCTGLKNRRKILISPRRVVSLKRELPKKR